MKYKLNFLLESNPLLENKRNFIQQRALNYIRVFIVYLGLLIYLFINPNPDHRLTTIIMIIVIYCTILAFSRKLQFLLFRRRLPATVIDIIMVFFLCYFSGGTHSPCFMAFLLPVLVSSIEPSFFRFLLVMILTFAAMFLLGRLTVFDSTLILTDAVYILFAGLLVNVLTYSDFRILTNYAIRDGLTGLFTHQYFYDKLERLLNEPSANEELSLIMIDLDEFKQLNDQFGHLYGDRVLKKVADTIKLNVRESDIVARYGGDEFAIILPEVDWDLCMSILERLRVSIVDLGYFTHVSAGCARYPEEATEIHELVNLADTRMYAEKNKNRYIIPEKPPIVDRRIMH